MEQKKKYRGIVYLMGLSQLLLTILVILWLGTQYDSAKESLYKQLNVLYTDAQEELIDTMLFRSYVNPVLSENMRIRTNIQSHSTNLKDDTSTNKLILSKGAAVSWQGTGNMITVNLETRSDSSVALPDTIRIRKAPEDVILRSVRMIVAHAEDTSGTGSRINGFFSFTPDTSEFKDRLLKKISESGLSVGLGWEDPADPIHDAGSGSMVIKPLTPFNLPGARVTGYRSHITRQILPQILFSALLTVISALAFYLSAKNIREQIIINNVRNDFIGNITHELKTPVATISVALESLLKYNIKDEPDRLREYISLALKEAGRLDELIAKVLDHSILENKDNPLNISSFDLNSLIKDAIETMNLKTGFGTIEFISGNEVCLINGDPLYIRSVILNILDNSIKYSERKPEIKVSAVREHNKVVIRVTDNGPGIPEEYRDRIFEKFFRVPTGNIHNVKGFGLGLSFAAAVVAGHKGTISYRNLDPGCEFTIKLPA